MEGPPRTFATVRLAVAEAAALLTATAPSEAAASEAAVQHQTDPGFHRPSATAAPAASAALPPSTAVSRHDPPPPAGNEAVNWSQAIVQQAGVNNGGPTSEGLPGSTGVQTGRQADATVAAAVGGGTGGGTSPLDATYPAVPSQLRLGRDASIAQVLASLNQLPIHSNAGQIPSPAQLSSLSHDELSQQPELTQPGAKPLQATPQQAKATQLSFPELGELAQCQSVTQPLSLVIERLLPQQLGPMVNLLPEQARTQPSEQQGGTQTPSPTQLRGGQVGGEPTPPETTAPLGSIVSLPQLGTALPKQPVLGTGWVQSAHGMPGTAHQASCHLMNSALSPKTVSVFHAACLLSSMEVVVRHEHCKPLTSSTHPPPCVMNTQGVPWVLHIIHCIQLGTPRFYHQGLAITTLLWGFVMTGTN